MSRREQAAVALTVFRPFPQAHWKGYKQRRKFKDRQQYLKDHSGDVVKVPPRRVSPSSSPPALCSVLG